MARSLTGPRNVLLEFGQKIVSETLVSHPQFPRQWKHTANVTSQVNKPLLNHYSIK